MGAGDAPEQFPQTGRAVLGGGFVARLHLHIQHQAQVGDEVGVVAMRGASGLVRVVAHHRALLMPVERLDGHVGIENPGLAQQRRRNIIEMTLQPLDPLCFVKLAQIAPHRVFADHFAHAQQRRVDAVPAQRADVRIALVTGENREHGRAQDIAVARGIGAGEHQRAALHPGLEQPADLQKLGEERQLPERRHRRLRVPLNVYAAAKRIHRHRAGSRYQRGTFSLTRWVTALIVHMRLLAMGFQPLRSLSARLNCGF